MSKSFDDIPDHILHRIFGALTPTDWRNSRRVTRRFDRLMLQLHRSAVRSIKLELSYDTTHISWNNFKETPMRCRVSAIGYLGVGPVSQGITAIDLRNFSVAGASGLERMIKKFMPHLVHVQIVPPFAQNLTTAGGHIYQKTESDWSHISAMQNTFQFISFLHSFCSNFNSLDVWLALGCYREETDRNDYHAAILNEWGFLRSLTLRVLLVEAALATGRGALGTGRKWFCYLIDDLATKKIHLKTHFIPFFFIPRSRRT